jgi:hypothetical protein
MKWTKGHEIYTTLPLAQKKKSMLIGSIIEALVRQLKLFFYDNYMIPLLLKSFKEFFLCLRGP